MSCHGPERKLLETFLALVEKPSRYIGGEVNAAKKDPSACRLSVALAFPDAYEVGMSHLGLQILYAILNAHPHICAERVYAPWPDMEARLRANGLALSSLESGAALSEFDLIGFSLQYELSYTNVLTMLELGGVPLRANERRGGDPVVIAGGPCVFNPLPMAPFFDAIVIGEGEEVISEIADVLLQAKQKGLRREGMLERLSEIAGVFVPSVFREGMKIRKRIIPDLDRWLFPVKPVVPLMNTIHDRITLEIARGCTRGCRFCQAGMVWRPVRERNPSTLLAMAEEALKATGYDEITLLSLSSGDYSRIEPLLKELMNRYSERRVALGLPSLRVETLSPALIEQIRKVRKTSFTIAPEAGTRRLRDIINKGNTEEDLIAAARRVYEGGWKAIKLYFMIGLPGEQEEDLEGIADLAHRVMREGRGRQVTLGLSTLVPKPHTPFQWVRQIGLEETLAKQGHLKRRVKNRNISFKWHDARMSLLEGLFSRGDERLADLVESAWRLGARFDGWSDQFRFELWEKALGERGIRLEEHLRERPPGEPLPWDFVDTGLDREFLLDEYEKSQRGEATPDCRIEGCRHCGVCDGELIAVREAAENAALPCRARGANGRRAHPDALAAHLCQNRARPVPLPSRGVLRPDPGDQAKRPYASILGGVSPPPEGLLRLCHGCGDGEPGGACRHPGGRRAYGYGRDHGEDQRGPARGARGPADQPSCRGRFIPGKARPGLSLPSCPSVGRLHGRPRRAYRRVPGPVVLHRGARRKGQDNPQRRPALRGGDFPGS